MKARISIIFSVLLLQLSSVFAQNQTLPDVKIKSLDGSTVSAADFSNEGKPIVVSFWATWCKPCIQELMTIADVYEDWQAETGVKLIAISVDDARSSMKVTPFVNGKGWEYEVYIDENQDLQRALNVVNVPHTFLLDGNGKIVYEHPSYQPGDEEHLLEEIKKAESK